MNGWKLEDKFPFGARPIFRGELLVSGSVFVYIEFVSFFFRKMDCFLDSMSIFFVVIPCFSQVVKSWCVLAEKTCWDIGVGFVIPLSV